MEEIGLTNEDYQKRLLLEFREEADFINKYYGVSDLDHFICLEVGHVYELMKEYRK